MIIDYSVIGKRIQRIRKEKHLSRLQLSAMVGISSGHLGHIETGSKSPSVEILVNIAFSLDVPVDELLVDLGLPKREGPEMSELLRNCSPIERSVLRELVAAIKPVLQKLDL
jgi:transcriptional regulator with XRE-family HTH domain